jgi:hypothetical protein
MVTRVSVGSGYHGPMEPAMVPLLLLQLPYVRALDPRSGRLLWETLVGEGEDSESAPGRFFMTAYGLFVMAGARIWLVDLATGRISGGIELPFTPDTAVFDGECFYIANVPEAAAVGVDGRVRWKMGIESGMWSGKLVCRDANNQVLWDRKSTMPMTSAAAGIALGSLVSQPDDKGLR